MATAQQILDLDGRRARQTPSRDRAQVAASLAALGTALDSLSSTKTLVDTIVTDAAAAAKNDYALETIQSDWSSDLIASVNAWSYDGKTGINALAQLIADLSEQGGLEGGANEMRLYRNGTVVEVSQDA